MRTFVCVCTIVIFIAVLTPITSARVLGSDLQNGVAAYYFKGLTDLGDVLDHSGNGLRGGLFDGAQLRWDSDRDYLSLENKAATFQAWNDNKSLFLSKAFSIVAWVKIPRQFNNNFLIEICTYKGPITSITHNIYTGCEGVLTLGVLTSGPVFGIYTYNKNEDSRYAESTIRNINNNRWQHIGFVVNSTLMKLYLNGTRIFSQSISGHEALVGTGTLVFIGEDARGSVDDVGFFKNDLTDAHVRTIYNQGLENIISVAPVDPSGKVATTWAALKQK